MDLIIAIYTDFNIFLYIVALIILLGLAIWGLKNFVILITKRFKNRLIKISIGLVVVIFFFWFVPFGLGKYKKTNKTFVDGTQRIVDGKLQWERNLSLSADEVFKLINENKIKEILAVKFSSGFFSEDVSTSLTVYIKKKLGQQTSESEGKIIIKALKKCGKKCSTRIFKENKTDYMEGYYIYKIKDGAKIDKY